MPKIRSNPCYRKSIYEKTNGCCAYCGCELSFYGFHIDHVVPKRRYKHDYEFSIKHGTDDKENLLPSCNSCNSCKSDLGIEEFRERIKDRVNRLNTYSSEYNTAKRFGLVTENNQEIIFYFEKLEILING